MIILINKETLLFETMSAARGRIALSLGLPIEWVKFTLEPADPDDGKLYPEVNFLIPDEVPEEHKRAKFFTESKSWVHEVIGGIVRVSLKELSIRREGARA